MNETKLKDTSFLEGSFVEVPLSLEFSRQEYWSGQPFPSPGDCPNPGIEPRSSALQADSLPSGPQGKPTETGEEQSNGGAALGQGAGSSSRSIY